MGTFLAPPIRNPLGNVETERMILRRFEPSDLDGLAAVFAHPEVWQFPRVCERLGMTFQRTVDCPATPRRGPVQARLFTTTPTDRLHRQRAR